MGLLINLLGKIFFLHFSTLTKSDTYKLKILKQLILKPIWILLLPKNDSSLC